MKTSRATGDSFQRQDMSGPRSLFQFERSFSSEEYELISNGLIPEQMEDKWFIYLESDWVNFHRSWTGYWVYRLRLVRVPSGYKVTEAWVNRDPKQYASRNEKHDAAVLEFLIDRLLLSKDVPFPSDYGYELGTGETAARTHQVFGYARSNSEDT